MIKCNLAEILARRELKIRDVSEATGVSRTTLTALNYNQGKGVQFETLDKICTFLDISPGELFSHFPFEFKAIEVLQTEEFSFEIECEFIFKNKSVKSTAFCTWSEDDNVLTIVIMSKLLNDLDGIPKNILAEVIEDFIQTELIKEIDISSSRARLSLYAGDIDDWINYELPKIKGKLKT